MIKEVKGCLSCPFGQEGHGMASGYLFCWHPALSYRSCELIIPDETETYVADFCPLKKENIQIKLKVN